MIPDLSAAKRQVASLTDALRSEILMHVADTLETSAEEILAANAQDLALMDPSNPLRDRLALSCERIAGIAGDMRNVASLPCPLGRTLSYDVRPNGLKIKKVSVPFGVIGIIYEARPNVTFDVFSICFKTGNVCLLKGGRDADNSNRAAVALIRGVLRSHGVCEDAVTLLPATHEATAQLLGAVGKVDLVIPRGGRRLIDFVRDNAKVPCIETGAGVVDTYIDKSADLAKASDIVFNAKTRRVSVCNALDCLIIHKDRLQDLPAICGRLAEKNVTIYADERSFKALASSYPCGLLEHSCEESWGTEYMDYKLSLKTVDSLDDALEHIARYGSGHSESIVTSDAGAAERFQAGVDAACVYVNAPTSFTDGAQFGLGAEIGISTQKLGARGPMGLSEMTSYKWLIEGNGQVRE